MRSTHVRPGHNLLVVVCAVSAGIHAVLVPEHFEEGSGAGAGFVAATVLLAALVVGLTRRPESAALLAAAALVLGGLLAAYALVVTSGLPLLHPERESLEALALATKGVEAAGLAFALDLLRRRTVFRSTPRQEGARP